MLHIDPWCCYFAAALILTVPLNWLFAAVCAAVFHECCHIAMLVLLGERIQGIGVHPWGITIETSFSSIGAELLSAAAGPLGSLSLVHLCHFWPAIALCAFLQGLFNLLPVYPLDGGRILFCLFMGWFPDHAEKMYCHSMRIIFVLLAAAATLAAKYLCLGILPVLAYLILLLRVILRKIPCKGGVNRVQ